jgi:hypothetical protein
LLPIIKFVFIALKAEFFRAHSLIFHLMEKNMALAEQKTGTQKEDHHQNLVGALFGYLEEQQKNKKNKMLGGNANQDRVGKAVRLLLNEDHLMGLFKEDGSVKTSGLSGNDDLQELSNITNDVTSRVKTQKENSSKIKTTTPFPIKDKDRNKIKTGDDLAVQESATIEKMASCVVKQNNNHYSVMYAESLWISNSMGIVKTATDKVMRKSPEELSECEKNLRDSWKVCLNDMERPRRYAHGTWQKHGVPVVE